MKIFALAALCLFAMPAFGQPLTLEYVGQHYSPAITVDLAGKTLSRVVVKNSSGLHFTGGTWVPADVKEQVVVTGSTDVTFTDADMLANGTAYCVKLTDSAKVGVYSSRLDHCFQAINAGRVTGLDVVANSIVGSFNDSLVLCGTSDFEISQNSIGGNLRVDGRHPDGIQFLEKTLGANDNIEVSGNVITGASQGIFGGPVRNLKVKDNYVLIDHANAIRVSGAFIEMTGNTVATLPGAAHLANIIMDPAALTKRSGNVRRAWGRFAEQRD